MIDAAEGDATLSANSLVQTYKAVCCFGGGAQKLLFIWKITWTVAAFCKVTCSSQDNKQPPNHQIISWLLGHLSFACSSGRH